MVNLFSPPPSFELPFSKGDDLYFVFKYMSLIVDVDGNPVLDAKGKKQFEEADYPDGATVTLIIDTDPAIVVEAETEGSLATVQEDFLIVDSVAKGKLWRAIITYPSGRDKVMCNGTTVRYDGQVKK